MPCRHRWPSPSTTPTASSTPEPGPVADTTTGAASSSTIVPVSDPALNTPPPVGLDNSTVTVSSDSADSSPTTSTNVASRLPAGMVARPEAAGTSPGTVADPDCTTQSNDTSLIAAVSSEALNTRGPAGLSPSTTGTVVTEIPTAGGDPRNPADVLPPPVIIAHGLDSSGAISTGTRSE